MHLSLYICVYKMFHQNTQHINSKNVRKKYTRQNFIFLKEILKANLDQLNEVDVFIVKMTKQFRTWGDKYIIHFSLIYLRVKKTEVSRL